MRKVPYILLFLFSFCLIWGTQIVNRTEADDAYEYAWQVEHSEYDKICHPHHVLYGVVTKGVYCAAQFFGYSGRAYPLMRLFSALSGAGVVIVFFRFCYHRFSMRPVSSLLCSLLLLFSYGFWRYANEVEVIAPACCIMLIALYISVNPRQSIKESAFAGILCGVSVLFHILNAIPVFIAIPLFYLLHKNWKGLIVNFALALLTVWTGYFFSQIYFFNGIPAFVFRPGALIRAAIGFSQCVFSSNILLGFEFVRDQLVNLFPTRMLSEEIFMGQALSHSLIIAGTLTMMILIVTFALSISGALYLVLRKKGGRRRDRTGAVDGYMTLVVTAVWFCGYAGAVLLLEPGNPEVWVMGLVPFWLTFCGLVVTPLSYANRLWVILLLLVCLGLHNLVGGILPLQNADGDYNQRKARWIFENAGPEDVVLTAANQVFERYFRYYSPAEVEYLYDWTDADFEFLSLEKRARNVWQRGGTIYIFDDVFSQPISLTKRFPGNSSRVQQFALKISKCVQKVHEDELGGIYRLNYGEFNSCN